MHLHESPGDLRSCGILRDAPDDTTDVLASDFCPVKKNVRNQYTQCGNFRIFLSLIFYVKSILGDSRSAKSIILPHLEALKFDFD